MRETLQRFYAGERFFWPSVAVLMVVAAFSGAEFSGVTVVVYATVVAVFCVRVFLGHGGTAVTPLGIWALITSLTAGYSGMVGWDDPRVSSEATVGALALTLVQIVGISLFAWGDASSWGRRLGTWSESRILGTGLAWGVLLGCVGAYRLVPSLGVLTEGVSFVCVFLVALGTWARPDARLISWGSFSVAVVVVIYVGLLHTGGGRLRIAALCLGVLIVASLRFPAFWIKIATITAIPVALLFLAWYRILFTGETFGGQSGRTGLESLTDPLITFAAIIDMQRLNELPAQGFANLLTPISFLFPDHWDIPLAFGYEVVSVWNTERYGSGYSAAANSAGEWFWMAGVVGVILSVPILGLYLRGLNYLIRYGAPTFMDSLIATLVFLGALALAGALGDMVWGGGHVYLYRSVARIATVVAVSLFLFLLRGVLVQQKPMQKGI